MRPSGRLCGPDADPMGEVGIVVRSGETTADVVDACRRANIHCMLIELGMEKS